MGNQVNFPKAACMTPYQCTFRPLGIRVTLLVLFFVVFRVTPAMAGETATSAAIDALTRSGLAHYYNLEYDQAIKDFQKAAEARPDDPKALNHLLEAVLFQQLFKYDALQTSLFTSQRFLNSKQVPVDPAVKQQIRQLTDKALTLSDKRLKSNPQDVDALYARGVTRALRSTYLGLVERSWFSGLRSSLAARNDHEEVLRLRPTFVDAKTVVGIHNYIVGSLPLAVRIMAGITGIRGDKEKGLKYLTESGDAGGESTVDARVALGLFLRREQRYDQSIKVVRTLMAEHPHNFLFALEEANLLKDGGKGKPAVTAYRALLDGCKDGRYPQSHPELAQFALGDALRGQNQYVEAIMAYEAAGNASSNNHELRQSSQLDEREDCDLITKREAALKQYRA